MKREKSVPVTIDGASGKPLNSPARIPCTRLGTVREIRREMATVYRQARHGRITTQEATRLTFCLVQMVKTFELEALQQRLAVLEEREALQSLG